jgi:hypothetical protein
MARASNVHASRRLRRHVDFIAHDFTPLANNGPILSKRCAGPNLFLKVELQFRQSDERPQIVRVAFVSQLLVWKFVTPLPFRNDGL